MPIGNLTAFLTYIMQILDLRDDGRDDGRSWCRARWPVRSGSRRCWHCGAIGRRPAAAGHPAPASPAVVEFRDVTLRLPGQRAPGPRDLTFTLRPGQTSAIIGGTGSGKTTLLSLIPRFFDPTAGAVLGQRGRRAGAGPRTAVGLHRPGPAGAFLFSGTVASNLRFGRPEATEAELWQRARRRPGARLRGQHARAARRPIDQGGTNVSGGQRQRLSIARALVKRPRLYLFDDCFSALDAATDARLRAALREHIRDATVRHRRPAGQHDHAGRPDHRARRRPDRRHSARTASCWLACAPYREIVASQLGEGVAA